MLKASSSESPITIVGAGLSGLACAVRLHDAGHAVQLIDRADGVGGRVRTDERDGFLLDRGFQVFLTSYPEAQILLDYDALDLRPFVAGADVAMNGRVHRFSDPWREPSDAIRTAFGPVAKWRDHLRILRLRQRVTRSSVGAVLSRPERSTRALLEEEGFSKTVIERFFQPFYRGVFLEKDLETSSRKFEFTFRMFATGLATLPRDGMGAIPAQLEARLPAGSIRLGAPVSKIVDGGVELESGESIASSVLVIATEEVAACRLLGEPVDPNRNPGATTCLYFDAPKSPIDDPILVLNGRNEGRVNTVAVPSLLSDRYAPEGRHLVSVSLVGCANVVGDREEACHAETESVLAELRAWFGDSVRDWRPIHTYRIPEALPPQPAGALDPPTKPARVGLGLYQCGDHLDLAWINGAFASGRRAAEAVLEDLA